MAGEVGRSDVIKGIKSFLDLKGSFTLGVSGEVLPTMLAADLTGGPFRWCRGGAVAGESTQVAAQFSQAAIVNAATSRSIIHIRKWHAGLGVAGQVNAVCFRTVSGPTLAGSTSGIQDWDIMAGFDESLYILGTSATLGTPNGILSRHILPAGESKTFEEEYVLRPGAAFYIQALTVNVSMISGIRFDRYSEL